jgi:hypothetical protein
MSHRVTINQDLFAREVTAILAQHDTPPNDFSDLFIEEGAISGVWWVVYL